jgi:hypothetical protein
MAPLYGVAPPADGLEERELGPSRGGYFAQIPFLLLNGHNNEPDSIRRGYTLHRDVLCADVGAPMPVLPPLPVLDPGQANR